MKKKTVALILTCMMAFSCPLAAGTVYAEEAAQSVQEEAAAPETIGEKQTDKDYQMNFENATGKAIKSVAISIDQADFTDLALSGEGTFIEDETRILYCTPKTKNEDGSDMTKPPVYDLKITFEDGAESILHTLPFGDAESVKICYEEPLAYIVFTSKSRNEEFNTLLSEKVKNGLMTSEEAYGSPDDGYGGDDYDDYDDYDYDYDYDDGGNSGNACLDDAILY